MISWAFYGLREGCSPPLALEDNSMSSAVGVFYFQVFQKERNIPKWIIVWEDTFHLETGNSGLISWAGLNTSPFPYRTVLYSSQVNTLSAPIVS